MAEAPIKGEEIIEKDVFANASSSAEILLTKLNELIASFKQIATITGRKLPLTDPKTISEAEQLSAALKKINELEKGLTETQKAQIAAQQIVNKQRADFRAQLKGEISAYQDLQNQYKKAADNARDLAVAQGIQSKAAQAAAKEANGLNDQLKAIDASIGNHQRNVGNYGATISKLGKGVAGLSGLFSTLGNFLGINTVALEAAHEASKELIKVVRELHHAEQLEKVAHVENTVAIETETVAQEEAAVATGLSTGGISLLIVAVLAGVAAIYEWVTASKTKNEIDLANLEVTGQLREDEEKHNKLLEEQTRLLLKLKVLKGEITQDDADAADAELNRLDKIKERAKRFGEEIAILKKNLGVSDKKEINGLLPTSIIGNKTIFDLESKTSTTIKAETLSQDEIKRAKDFNEQKLRLQKQFLDDINVINKNAAIETEIVTFERPKSKLKELQSIQIDGIKITQDIIDEGYKSIEEKADEHFANMKIKVVKSNNEILEEDKKTLKKEAEQREKLEDEIFKGISEGLKKKEELQQQGDQREIDMKTRALEIQTQLAAGGQQNVLAETLAQQAKAEEKKLQDAKKAAKQQETIALIETFSSTLNAALKSDKPFIEAFGEALIAEGFVSAAFSKLFAGFYEGTDALGEKDGVKVGEGKDNILIRAHKGERILGVNDSADIPDGMTNKEVVEAANMFHNPDLKTVFIPRVGESRNDQAIQAEQMAEVIGREVNKAMSSAFEKMPRSTAKLNRLGEWTEEMQEGTMKTVLHHKRSESRPSLRLNG